MPSPWLALLIVAFWLGSVATLAWREVAPLLEPDRPPPFTIDLVAEATGQEPTVFWSVWRLDEGKEPRAVGKARTTLKQFQPDDDIFRNVQEVRPPKTPDAPGDETFVLHGELIDLELYANPVVRLLVKKMETFVRVDRAGALRWLGAKAEMVGEAGVGRARTAVKLKVVSQGEVIGRRFAPTAVLDSEFAGRFEIKADPVEVPPASLLNPMQPVNRVTGLRRGMRWRMPVIDPLGDAFRASAKQYLGDIPAGPRWLDAEVLPATERVDVKAGEFDCLVVEAKAEGLSARTYVRAADGLVLRQEARSARTGDHFRLRRE